MITVSEVGHFFQTKYVWMVRVLRPVFAVRCTGPEAVEEAIQNTIALAFENVMRCADLGKIATPADLVKYVKESMWYGVRQTLAGRMPHDKSDRTSRRKWGDVWDQMQHTTWQDYFVGRGVPVPDEVAFRLDLAEFLSRLSERQRLMLWDMACGMDTKDIAAKYGVSWGRISQLRAQFRRMLEEFLEL